MSQSSQTSQPFKSSLWLNWYQSLSQQSSLCSDTSSMADTEILSTSSLDRSVLWPEVFKIPKFSVDVEYRLRQGHLLYLRDGTYFKVTKELKHVILEKLAEVIYAFDAYPTKEDLAAVAKALVETHPCLKELGSPSGCVGWKNSLKFKVGNYRAKMCKLGQLDITVNSGKRGRYSTNSDPPNKGIKKPRKGEINFLPQYPDHPVCHPTRPQPGSSSPGSGQWDDEGKAKWVPY